MKKRTKAKTGKAQTPSLRAVVRRYKRTGCTDPDCMCGGSMEECDNGEYVPWNYIQQIHQELEYALLHLSTNIDIDGNSMADSDAAHVLIRLLSPNDKGQR